MARQIKGLPLLPPWSRKEVVALLLFWSWARAGIRTHIAKQYSYAKHGVLIGVGELAYFS